MCVTLKQCIIERKNNIPGNGCVDHKPPNPLHLHHCKIRLCPNYSKKNTVFISKRHSSEQIAISSE